MEARRRIQHVRRSDMGQRGLIELFTRGCPTCNRWLGMDTNSRVSGTL